MKLPVVERSIIHSRPRKVFVARKRRCQPGSSTLRVQHTANVATQCRRRVQPCTAGPAGLRCWPAARHPGGCRVAVASPQGRAMPGAVLRSGWRTGARRAGRGCRTGEQPCRPVAVWPASRSTWGRYRTGHGAAPACSPAGHLVQPCGAAALHLGNHLGALGQPGRGGRADGAHAQEGATVAGLERTAGGLEVIAAVRCLSGCAVRQLWRRPRRRWVAFLRVVNHCTGWWPLEVLWLLGRLCRGVVARLQGRDFKQGFSSEPEPEREPLPAPRPH